MIPCVYSVWKVGEGEEDVGHPEEIEEKDPF
jgi:hypothetical protein